MPFEVAAARLRLLGGLSNLLRGAQHIAATLRALRGRFVKPTTHESLFPTIQWIPEPCLPQELNRGFGASFLYPDISQDVLVPSVKYKQKVVMIILDHYA